MQTKHMSDCFNVEKMPSCPVRDINMHKKSTFHVIVVLLWMCFLHAVQFIRELRLTCCPYSFQNPLLHCQLSEQLRMS